MPPDGAPSLLVRLAVMIYEAFLLAGLAFAVGFVLLGVLRWRDPLTAAQLWTFQGALFCAFGAYFVYCWTRSGQTLAMKSWQLRIIGRDGRPPRLSTAVLRYLLAWTLLAPGFALVAVLRPGAWTSLALIALGVFAMLLATLADAGRQALHDRLLGTRLIRSPPH